MTPSEKIKQQSRDSRFQRVMQQCRAAMEPHQDKMETDVGKVGMVMVSGIALLVHAGIESPAALASTIKFAAEMSGIPEDALDAYAHFVTASKEGCEFARQQNKSPR